MNVGLHQTLHSNITVWCIICAYGFENSEICCFQIPSAKGIIPGKGSWSATLMFMSDFNESYLIRYTAANPVINTAYIYLSHWVQKPCLIVPPQSRDSTVRESSLPLPYTQICRVTKEHLIKPTKLCGPSVITVPEIFVWNTTFRSPIAMPTKSKSGPPSVGFVVRTYTRTTRPTPYHSRTHPIQ